MMPVSIYPIQFLHLGLGAFHRAHQAVFIKSNIASVSMRKSDVADSLSAIGNKYEVISADANGESSLIVESIKESLFYTRDFARIANIVQSSDLKAITLTVTEKAYRGGEVDGVPARLAKLLNLRFESGAPGLAIISCDNVPSNSEFLKKLVLDEILKNYSAELYSWVKQEIRAPNSMIDRIVPAMTTSAVRTEYFNQWVIESDPIAELFIDSGVQFVPDVKPYEQAKIRLFNGVHSTLAYIGEVEGIEFIADVISQPIILKYIKAMQEQEMVPSILDTGGIDLKSYAATILERISNPTLHHRTHQIAMDGSQKMQQRIFDAMNDLDATNKSAFAMCTSVAIWLHFLAISSNIDDPLGYKLTPLCRIQDPMTVVREALSLPEFSRKLSDRYFSEIATTLAEIRNTSVLQVISKNFTSL